jgi:hypothetical protein
LILLYHIDSFSLEEEFNKTFFILLFRIQRHKPTGGKGKDKREYKQLLCSDAKDGLKTQSKKNKENSIVVGREESGKIYGEKQQKYRRNIKKINRH